MAWSRGNNYSYFCDLDQFIFNAVPLRASELINYVHFHVAVDIYLQIFAIAILYKSCAWFKMHTLINSLNSKRFNMRECVTFVSNPCGP